MRQLSLWATNHCRAARVAIFGCYAVANLLGYFLGFLMNLEGFMNGPALLFITAVLTAASLVHPKKGRAKAPAYSYARHKVCDGIICLGTVCLLAFCAASALQTTEPSQASIRWDKAEREARQPAAAAKWMERQKHGVAHFLQKAGAWYRDLGDGEKALLMALTIIVTVAFCILWAALCCSLACNGLSFLAVLLFLVGVGGAVVGCVYLCRRILRGPRRRRYGFR
jgi:hypothetical protein